MAAAAACDNDASGILGEGCPVVAEEASGNDEETPMLTAAADAAASTAPFNKDYRLDFTEVEGNLEEIPEEGTSRMAMAAAATVSGPVPGGTLSLDGAKQEDVGVDVESEETAVTTAVVAAATAHFHIPESNASDVAFSECSFQVSYFDCLFLLRAAIAERVNGSCLSSCNKVMF